jgi:predicted ATPase
VDSLRAGRYSPVVIVGVRIKSFRGVRDGQLDGLGPVSVLVGPNNSGKSTCLEAITTVAAAGSAADAVNHLLRRGGPAEDAVAHLLYQGSETAELSTIFDDGGACTCQLKLVGVGYPEGVRTDVQTAATCTDSHGTAERNWSSAASIDREARVAVPYVQGGAGSTPFRCALVDVQSVRAAGALEDAYTNLERAGRVPMVVRALARSLPGLTDLRILKAGNDFILHAAFGSAPPVPIYLTGDGSKRFIELAAAIASGEPAEVVLLEEPECYQHPRYLRELAALLLSSAKEGRQVILSTHSIELIDVLLEAAEEGGLSFPFVHRLRLVDGTLRATTLSREQAAAARKDLLEDLRA